MDAAGEQAEMDRMEEIFCELRYKICKKRLYLITSYGIICNKDSCLTITGDIGEVL